MHTQQNTTFSTTVHSPSSWRRPSSPDYQSIRPPNRSPSMSSRRRSANSSAYDDALRSSSPTPRTLLHRALLPHHCNSHRALVTILPYLYAQHSPPFVVADRDGHRTTGFASLQNMLLTVRPTVSNRRIHTRYWNSQTRLGTNLLVTVTAR